jgi:hypothetical protein
VILGRFGYIFISEASTIELSRYTVLLAALKLKTLYSVEYETKK